MDAYQPARQLLTAILGRSLRDALGHKSPQKKQRAINWFFDDEPKKICGKPLCNGCHSPIPSRPCPKLKGYEVLEFLDLDVTSFRDGLLKYLKR